MHKSQECDDTSVKFKCRVCKKTFYNAIALQNHRKLQHDLEGLIDSIEILHSTCQDDLSYDEYSDFKYIPLNENSDDQITVDNEGITRRVYSEDTTYLIVKIEAVGKRRTRFDSSRRNQMRPGKPPVDLRGPFTCTLPSNLRPDIQCRQIFFNCCEYSLHYREEHTKRRKAALRCQVCEKRLDRDIYAESLETQLKIPSRLNLFCRICGITFLSSTEYTEHNRMIHAKMKPHQCSLCSKRFTQQGGLLQHMRMHAGIRPFGCTFCPKAFTQKAGLDQHLRTHTKVKPFKCVICSKCFSQSVHLRQHMRTHTNIQPFECPVCGRRFKQSSHLNFHMRSHISEKTSLMDQYTQSMQHQNDLNIDQIKEVHTDFLNLANFQPVQDGETMYYAAELASSASAQNIAYPHFGLPESLLSL